MVQIQVQQDVDHWNWHTSSLLTFSSYRNQNFYAFVPIVNSRNPVNWVLVTSAKGAPSCRRVSPFPLLQDGEGVDMVQDLIEEIVSREDALSHTVASSSMPFRFWVTSRLPSERSVSSEHQQDCSPTPKHQRCYCIQVRVMLGDGGHDQPHCPMFGKEAWLLTYFKKPGQMTT